MDRRNFITAATIATGALALSACDKPTTSTSPSSTSSENLIGVYN
jgi:hypothetical protein